MIEWMYCSQLDGRNDFKEKATMRWRAHYADKVDRLTNWLITVVDRWIGSIAWSCSVTDWYRYDNISCFVGLIQVSCLSSCSSLLQNVIQIKHAIATSRLKVGCRRPWLSASLSLSLCCPSPLWNCARALQDRGIYQPPSPPPSPSPPKPSLSMSEME